MRQARDLEITEQQVFVTWLNSLSGEQMDAWNQDMKELAKLVGIKAGPKDREMPEEDKPRAYPITELMMALWMIHQAGYPLPVLQSLREGKGPDGQL